MQVIYGSYAFNANGVEWATAISLLRNGAQVIGRKVTVTLKGRLEADGQAALAVASGNLQRALQVPYLDLYLKSDAGAILEAMTSVGSTTGVLCVDGPNFPIGVGAEYATYRTFSATFEAEYPAPTGVPLIVEYRQTVSTEGGFPVIVWQPAINGPPRKVQTSPSTTYRATQSGSAIGLLDWPIPPGPIFGVQHLVDNPVISRTSPDRVGNGFRNFPVQWSYQFESTTPLQALPGLPP